MSRPVLRVEVQVAAAAAAALWAPLPGRSRSRRGVAHPRASHGSDWRQVLRLPLLAGENIGSRFVVPTVAGCLDVVVHIATEQLRAHSDLVVLPPRLACRLIHMTTCSRRASSNRCKGRPCSHAGGAGPRREPAPAVARRMPRTRSPSVCRT